MTREEKEQIDKYVLQMARLLEDGCYQQEMLLKAVHIIDEALEQEPTTNNNLGVTSELEKNSKKLEKDFGESDCISRQAVLDLIADYDLSMGQVVRGIHALPPVTPQEPRWIPVSERLPENKETVLVTFKHFVSGNTIGLGSVILLRDKPHWHVREQNLGTYDVLAWKPLPQPYREVENE